MDNNNKHKQFTIDELSSLTGMNRRTVRYYIQQGLLNRPQGTGKGAWYTRDHLQQLLAIAKWKSAGLNLDRIRDLVSSGEGGELVPPPRPRQPGSVEVRSHILLADGLELQVDVERAKLTPEQLRALARIIIQSYQEIMEEEK
jgi:DNA-binding transcriptional MerR regulator